MAVAGMPLLAVTVLHASTVAVAAIAAPAYMPWLIIGRPAGAWVDRLPLPQANDHLRHRVFSGLR
jgi:hypothetical protein